MIDCSPDEALVREVASRCFPGLRFAPSGATNMDVGSTPRMAVQTSSMLKSRPVASAAIAIAVTGAATILGAWILQYGMGLQPCPLCLEQRYAYYFAVPLAVMVAVGDQAGASRKVLLAAVVAIAAGMLWNAAL